MRRLLGRREGWCEWMRDWSAGRLRDSGGRDGFLRLGLLIRVGEGQSGSEKIAKFCRRCLLEILVDCPTGVVCDIGICPSVQEELCQS